MYSYYTLEEGFCSPSLTSTRLDGLQTVCRVTVNEEYPKSNEALPNKIESPFRRLGFYLLTLPRYPTPSPFISAHQASSFPYSYSNQCHPTTPSFISAHQVSSFLYSYSNRLTRTHGSFDSMVSEVLLLLLRPLLENENL